MDKSKIESNEWLVLPLAGGGCESVKNLWLTSLITMPCANNACHCCGETYAPLGGGNRLVGCGTGLTVTGSLRNSTWAELCAGIQLTPPSVLSSVNMSKKLPTM